MKTLNIEEKQVLYVDDDQENLDGFLYSFAKEFKIFIAKDLSTAWEILANNEIKVIISDQRMPENTGIQFLNEVEKQYPNIVRIILTAYADIDTLIEAINKGNVYRFHTKPWNREDLLFTIENAIETFLLRKENLDLLKNLKRTNEDLERSNSRLKESEIRFRTLFEQAGDGILVGNPDGIIIDVNSRMLEIINYDKEDIIGKNINILFLQTELKENPLRYDLLNKGEITVTQRNINTRKQSEVFVEMSTKRLEDGRLQVLFRDITQERITREALVESENKFRNIFNNSNDAILISTIDGKLVEGNNVFYEKIQFNKEKLQNINLFDLMPVEYHKARNKRIAEIISKGYTSNIELELVNENGVAFPVELDSKLINYSGEDAILTVIRDIAERKITERKVLDAVISTEERERERFAKNLHDDLGPLLSSIKMYMNSFMNTVDAKKQVYIIDQVNEIIMEAIQTTKQVSNDLSPHILTNYGIVSAVENFISKLSDYIAIKFESNLENIRFENSLETTFYRIVKELINNTIKHAKAKNIVIKLNKKKKKLILLYLDDGIGFDINTIDKKGMGLYNLMSRIKSLNGKFEFENPEKGIKIKIDTPIVQ